MTVAETYLAGIPGETIIGPPGTTSPRETPMFDRDQYLRPELRIQEIDGHQIDKPRLKFTGAVQLDRLYPNDVELFNTLPLGAEVQIKATVRVTRIGVTLATNTDGDPDHTQGERTLAIEAIWAA